MSNCRFVNAVRHSCHKKGHLARKCMAKLQNRDRAEPRKGRNEMDQAHFLEDDNTNNTWEKAYTLYQISGNKVEPYRVTLDIN